MSNTDCFTCRYAYLEYASETEAAEAVKRYQDVELDGHRLYVIKAMTDRLMSFGETTFTVTDLSCANCLTFKISVDNTVENSSIFSLGHLLMLFKRRPLYPACFCFFANK